MSLFMGAPLREEFVRFRFSHGAAPAFLGWCVDLMHAFIVFFLPKNLQETTGKNHDSTFR